MFAMRDLLSRTGHTDLGRLDDHQVRAAARALLTSGARLRSLSDIQTVLAFFSDSPAGDRMGLRQLLDRAIDLLEFTVEPDKGLLYAGQYATMQNLWMKPDDRLVAEIRAAAPLPSGAADKTTIAHTRGGKWLLRWNLRSLVASEGEGAAWAHATKRFMDALSGDVEVLLSFNEYDPLLRKPDWHPLYEVPGVKKVIYYLDDDSRRLMNPPKELFGEGVMKRAFGIALLFRAGKK
jgi:hypothetical protein